MDLKSNNTIIYMARLHWVIFLWPVLIFFVLLGVSISVPFFSHVAQFGAFFCVCWFVLMWLTYHFSYLLIKRKQVVLCRGILVRQTLDLPLSKISSIDIRQSIFGTLLQYGSLIITSTGGTQQCINYVSKPLTCRRYIEEILHD